MRRIIVPDHVKHRYQLYPPVGNKNWRVIRLEPGRKSITIHNSSIDLILQLAKKQELSSEEARKQLELAIEQLYKADGVRVARVESNRENEQLGERYIKLKVETRTKGRASSRAAAANYVRAAIRAIGELSLMAASAQELQEAIDAFYLDHRQRRAVTTLNSVLKWAGRTDVVLELRKDLLTEVRYIRQEDWPRFLSQFPTEAWQALATIALNSGLRIGECFALERAHKRRWGLYVAGQVLRDGSRALPKNGKARTVAAFQPAIDTIDKWTLLKRELSSTDRLRASEIVSETYQRAFPSRRAETLTFHDLRHSYAIAALEQGLSLEWIAKQLGNAIEVTERHYIGHVQTAAMEEAAYLLLNNLSKKEKTG